MIEIIDINIETQKETDYSNIYKYVGRAIEDLLGNNVTVGNNKYYSLKLNHNDVHKYYDIKLNSFWQSALDLDDLGGGSLPRYNKYDNEIPAICVSQKGNITLADGIDEFLVPIWQSGVMVRKSIKNFKDDIGLTKYNSKQIACALFEKAIPTMHNNISKLLLQLFNHASLYNPVIKCNSTDFWDKIKESKDILCLDSKNGNGKVFVSKEYWDCISELLPNGFNIISDSAFPYLLGEWNDVNFISTGELTLKYPLVTLQPKFCGVIPIRGMPLITVEIKNENIETMVSMELGMCIDNSKCAQRIVVA